MDLFDRLANQELSLNQTENKIIEYILQNMHNFETMNIQKISDKLFISPNTIVRLCKKIGYSGFSELKYEIMHTNNSKDENDTPIHYEIDELFHSTLSINSTEKIQEVAKEIYNCEQLVIFGLGLSHMVALDLSKKLTHLNKLVIVPDDRDNCKLLANNLKKGQVAMILSLSGDTDIIKSIGYIAKTKNIPIISLTGLGQSPISSLSNINLYCNYNKLYINDYDLSSRFGFYILTELIFQEYLKLYYQESK